MRPLAFLVVALVVALVALGAACGGGGGGAPDASLPPVTLAAGDATFTYGGFRWGANNDCPAAGASVISVTIRGAQTDPPAEGRGLGVCLPRPDLIGAAPVPLSDPGLIQLVGASAEGGGCVLQMAAAAQPAGSVTFTGFAASEGASYTMSFAGSVVGTRACGDGGPEESVTLTLAGTAAVAPQ